MKYTSKKLSHSQVELLVSFDLKSEFSPIYNEIFDQYLANVDLKGFRKGQAPKELAQQAVNPEVVFEEAAKRLIKQSLDNIFEENNWIVIESPKIEVGDADKDNPPAGGKNFSYKATLTLFPEIKLPNYKKIAKDIFSKKTNIKITDKEIDDTLNWLRESRAKVKLVDRPTGLTDQVELDFKASIEGETNPGNQSPSWRFDIEERNLGCITTSKGIH